MTGIVMTVGPATNSKEQLIRCYKQGVRILRFNFPHYTTTTLARDIKTIRAVEKVVKGKFQLLLDTE
jgi:pyruvate kinase